MRQPENEYTLFLSSLINEVSGKISARLNKSNYSIHTSSIDPSRECERINKNGEREYVLVHTSEGGFGRNMALTAERIAIMLDTKDALMNMSEELRALSNNNRVISDTVNTFTHNIRTLLTAQIISNNDASAEHNVIHQSYNQNRLKSQGVFSSWWNKTLFQSRTNTALEESLAVLDSCVEAFQKRENKMGLGKN